MKLALLLLPVLCLAGETITGGSVKEIIFMRLDKGDLLLESIDKAIDSNKITTGAVLTAAGAVEECKFHGVGGTMTDIKEPLELNNLNGIIADGKTHLHITVSSKALGALGGHLEKGCKVANHVELTIARFRGPALTRVNGELKKK